MRRTENGGLTGGRVKTIWMLSLIAVELQRFEGSFAEVAVFQVDLAEFGFGDLSGVAEDVADDGPAELKGFVFAAGKRGAGEPDGSGVERGRFELAKVFGKDFGFLEFFGGGADLSAGLGEAREEFGFRKGGDGVGQREWGRTRHLVPYNATFSLGGGEREGERKLVLFAEGLGVVAEVAQGLGELGGKAVEREDFFGLDLFDEFDEVREVGVVAERECGVGLVTEAAVGIDSPAGEDGDADFAEVAHHGGVGDVRRTEKNFTPRGTGFVFFVGGKALAEAFVDFGEAMDGAVEHDGQARFAEAAEDFLGFAETVAEEDGSFVVVEGFAAEADDALNDFGGGRETVFGLAVRRLHDEDVGFDGRARFGGEAAAEFEIASVEKGLAAGFDEGHRAAEDVAGGSQRDVERLVGVIRDSPFFAEFEEAFDPFAADARVHEFGSGRAENDFAMERCVIGMGVADEADFVFCDLGFVWIKPESERGQENAAAIELDGKR